MANTNTDAVMAQAIALVQKFNPLMGEAEIRKAIQSIEQLPQDGGATPVGQAGPGDRSYTDIESLYWGLPTAEDLGLIEEHTGHKWSPDDWYLVPMRASDNLMHRSWEVCWHGSVLLAMAQQLPGESLMTDHEAWEVGNTKGFFLRSLIAQSRSAPAHLLESMGYGPQNRDRVKQEGWIQVYLLAAIPAHEVELIRSLKTRQIEDVSTGSILNGATFYCPHCSAQRGRDIAFEEKDADNQYICPHEIPHPILKMLAEWGWIDDSEFEWADYAIQGVAQDGGQQHYETSFVGVGNLPSAEVLRPAKP